MVAEGTRRRRAVWILKLTISHFAPARARFSPAISFSDFAFELRRGRGRHPASTCGVDSLRRALSPEFAAGALAVFIPWRGGPTHPTGARDGTRADGVLDRRRRRQFSFFAYCLASYRVIAASTRRRRSVWILRLIFSRLTRARDEGSALVDAGRLPIFFLVWHRLAPTRGE